jgi:flagellar biosynthesis/type III secretory pathway ATPase
VRIGEYKKDADAVTDEAISRIDAVKNFLTQGLHDKESSEDTIQKLKYVVGL